MSTPRLTYAPALNLYPWLRRGEELLFVEIGHPFGDGATEQQGPDRLRCVYVEAVRTGRMTYLPITDLAVSA